MDVLSELISEEEDRQLLESYGRLSIRRMSQDLINQKDTLPLSPPKSMLQVRMQELP